MNTQPASETDDKDTLSSRSDPSSSATLWLVDWRGLGYPLSSEPLQIGRNPEAGILVEDSNVSRLHATIKVEGNRCFVRDENSANGTLVNGQRIQTEWQLFDQSDVLMIGPARFYLTTTRPVRLAGSSPVVPNDPNLQLASVSTHTRMMTPRPVTIAKKSTAGMSWPMILLIALIGLCGIGVIAWFVGSNRAQSDEAETSQLQPTTSIEQTQSIAGAVATTQTVATLPLETEAMTIVTQRVQESSGTALTQQTITPFPEPTDQLQPTVTPPATTTSMSLPTAPPASALFEAPELTVTLTITTDQTVTTVTTTGVVAGGTPTPASLPARVIMPTPVPLDSSVTVAQLGVKEIIDVDLNPKNSNEVFVVVKGDGIYKSVNGGDGPWIRIDLDGSAITRFTIDGSNPLRLYASTWNAVLKSIDGGNSWETLSNGLVANRTVDVVVVHPTMPNTLYAGIGESLVVSTDQGLTWTSMGYGQGLGVARLHQIVIDPFQPNVIYVAGIAAAIYKSENGGRDFKQLAYNVGHGAYEFVAHPSQPGVYLAGIHSLAAGIVKCENGVTCHTTSSGLVFEGGETVYGALVYAPANPAVVYAGSGLENGANAQGIFKSSDGGESWSPINQGLPLNPVTNTPYYVKSIVVHPVNLDIVWAATGSGLYKSTDGGQNWYLE